MGDLDNVRRGQEFARFLDVQQTSYNKSKVIATSDTPLLVQLESARQFDQDQEIEQYNTRTAAGQLREKGTGLKLQASLTRLEGRARAQAFRMQGYQSLLGGATSAATNLALA